MPNTETIFTGAVDTDTLGNRLLRARESSGYSQEQFARNLGVRKSTIESWEADRSEPRAHHLVRAAGMLGVSPSWMLGGVGPAPADESISDEIRVIRQQLSQMKALRDQTTATIEGIENALARLSRKDDA